MANHDHHYLDAGETYSGFQPAMQGWDFNDALNKNVHHLQIAYLLDDVLFTHAGVSPIWMDDTFYRDTKQGWSKDTMVEDLNELYLSQTCTIQFQPFRLGPKW